MLSGKESAEENSIQLADRSSAKHKGKRATASSLNTISIAWGVLSESTPPLTPRYNTSLHSFSPLLFREGLTFRSVARKRGSLPSLQEKGAQNGKRKRTSNNNKGTGVALFCCKSCDRHHGIAGGPKKLPLALFHSSPPPLLLPGCFYGDKITIRPLSNPSFWKSDAVPILLCPTALLSLAAGPSPPPCRPFPASLFPSPHFPAPLSSSLRRRFVV